MLPVAYAQLRNTNTFRIRILHDKFNLQPANVIKNGSLNSINFIKKITGGRPSDMSEL